MTQRLLRLYALVFAASGLAFVAASPLVYAAVNLAVGLVPGARRLTDIGPGYWLVLTGSMMAMISYLSLEAARDPGQEAAWNTLLLSKFMSTTLFLVFAVLERNTVFLVGAVVDGSIFLHLRYLRRFAPPSPRAHFASRFPSEGPFYEVWFSKINDEKGNALWLRYTAGRGVSGEEASCWYILFDKEAGRTINGRWTRPLKLLNRGEDVPFELEGSRFAPGWMVGQGDGVKWDFVWSRPAAPPFSFIPKVLALVGAAKSDYITPVSLAYFDGCFSVEGRDYVFRKSPGAIGHVWGRAMADNWRWAHAAFGDSVFEILSAQVRVGPLTLPRLTTANLWHGGKLYRSVGLWQAFQNESAREGDRWRFRVGMGEVTVEGECAPEPKLTAQLDYESPDGTRLICRNSKTGAMTLRLSGLADAKLETKGAAAVEFVEARQ